MTAEVVPLRDAEDGEDVELPDFEAAHPSPRYQLLTVAEAAVILRKSEAQLRWMVHRKTAPPSGLIGGRRMFRLADVEAHIDAAFAAEQADAAG